MNNQATAPANNLTSPRGQLSHIKKNGDTYYRKQNHQCLICGTQFVIRDQRVSAATKELIVLRLLERISLRGICRVARVSLCRLSNFIEKLYNAVPEDLHVCVSDQAEIEIWCLEADEIWSFVGRKENKRWIWLIIERRTRQIIAVSSGDRCQQSAAALWERVPACVTAKAVVVTAKWEADALAIGSAQHTACDTGSGQTSLIERFNCPLRQRVARLGRKSLSFSKSDWFHQAAIKYFIAHYNQERQKIYFAT